MPTSLSKAGKLSWARAPLTRNKKTVIAPKRLMALAPFASVSRLVSPAPADGRLRGSGASPRRWECGRILLRQARRVHKFAATPAVRGADRAVAGRGRHPRCAQILPTRVSAHD